MNLVKNGMWIEKNQTTDEFFDLSFFKLLVKIKDYSEAYKWDEN